MKTTERHSIHIRGVVQGVGFRPFVYRLAVGLSLSGWVRNVSGGVDIEVEGPKAVCKDLVGLLRSKAPVSSAIHSIEVASIETIGESGFSIENSTESLGQTATEALADLATCTACIREIFDPNDRRYQYPFTSCIECGPRYTIIREMPYDRCRTSFEKFVMCDECLAEYQDPDSRRFHAQTNACPTCGPKLTWLEPSDRLSEIEEAAMSKAVEAIRRGGIVAVKGLGGFHLVGDATNAEAIGILRDRKQRESKPFAVMFESLRAVLRECEVSASEAEMLTSRAAPIVLLRRGSHDSFIPESVAPANPNLGVMLPYTSLHHLLMKRVGRPLIATSGNVGEEPICIENSVALSRLENLVDGFLMHNYELQRAVDDSVVRVAAGRKMVLRRSRGYAPSSIAFDSGEKPVLALGSDLKNTLAVADKNKVFISQHIGDLANAFALDVFESQRVEFTRLFCAEPAAVAVDQHPGFYGSRLNVGSDLARVEVQHHHAHVAACLADNSIFEEVLGVVWDGSGYGDDGTIWGGEFLIATFRDYQRLNYLRPYSLLGGEQAIRRSSLAALGMLFELGIDPSGIFSQEFSQNDLSIYRTMFDRGINCPHTSSMGRMFDAVSALAGVSMKNRYEGESAMRLEFELPSTPCNESYSIPEGRPLDWGEMICEVIADVKNSVSRSIISARFHNAMVRMILEVAKSADRSYVALSGGCFQNRYLLEHSIGVLRASGFIPLWHHQVPPNDGGIALGQACVASRKVSETSSCV